MSAILTLGVLLASAPANAGKCDAYLAKADTAKGEALAKAFGDLAKCDKALAEDHYNRFLSGATDADTLVALSKSAIMWEVWNPVWTQLGKIKDYSARDVVAMELGSSCGTEAKIVPFLQGAYFGLRALDFNRWKKAYTTCESSDLSAWMTKQIEKPPESEFDEKYGYLLEMYIAKEGKGSLPTLTKAAIAAAEKGPFEDIVAKMDSAVAPELGGTISGDDKKALEGAMVKVAQNVWPERAKSVADRLANSGNEDAAAQLLPSIYPEAKQGGGGFLYGAASFEQAECKGEKTVVIHVAEMSEPGKRWNVLPDTEKVMRDFKPKLAKCTAEDGDWGVAVTKGPVKSGKDIDAWVKELEAQKAEEGYAVKVQSEKPVSLN